MILPVTQAARFFKLFDMVTVYAHRKLQVVSDAELYDESDPRGIAEVAQRETCEELWHNCGLLDDFVRDNPYNLQQRDLGIVDSWQDCLAATFFVSPLPSDAGALATKAPSQPEFSFTYDNQTFVVSGLTKHLETMFTRLPALVHTTLLPFEDKVVYAMFMSEMPVDMGDGFLKELNELLTDNIAAGNVVRTGAEFVMASREVRERKVERDLEDLRHGIEMEERASGPLEGQHRGALAGLNEEERKAAIDAHMREAFKGDDRTSLKEFMQKRCLKGEPRFKLEELIDLPVTDAALLGVFDEEDRAYWLSLAEPENLQMHLDYADERELKNLRELASRGGQWRISAEELEGLGSVAGYPYPAFGLCYYFRDGDGIVAVMPREVAETARSVDWDAALAYARDRKQLFAFLDELAELRGIARMGDAVRAYRTAYPAGFANPAEITDLIYNYLGSDELNACMFQTNDAVYLLHYELLWEHRREQGRDPHKDGAVERGEPGKLISWIMREQRGKDPRVPTAEMLARGSAFFWAMEQPPALSLRDFLDAHVPDDDNDYSFADRVIEELMSEVFWGQPQGSTQAFFDILERNGFIPDESQLNQLVSLWTNMCNGLPNWPNNGWSPNELAGRMSNRRLFFNPDGSVMKVGRNDPCPCGSGKKYKRCCGRW